MPLKGPAPPSITAAPSFDSSAKLLEETLQQSAARVRPRNVLTPGTPGSALMSSGAWGAKRQNFNAAALQRDMKARLGTVEKQPVQLQRQGTIEPVPDEEEEAADDEEETVVDEEAAAAAAAAAIEAEVDAQLAEASQMMEAAAASGDEGEAAEMEEEDGGEGPPTPSRKKGLAGQLARARALLADSIAEKARLEDELVYERGQTEGAVAAATADLQQELDEERTRYRREIEFVRAGVNAAEGAREAANVKRKEAHEKAMKRAVRDAESRAGAEAEVAAKKLEETYTMTLAGVEARYEAQIANLKQQMISLAVEVRRIQGEGKWPGGPDPPEEDEDEEEEAPPLDVGQAHKLLAGAIANVEQAAAAPPPPPPPPPEKPPPEEEEA